MNQVLRKGLAGGGMLLGLAAGGFGERQGSAVDQLAWMAGDWRCTLASGNIFEETWMAPAGGTMQGVGREIKGGKVIFMEFLSIEPNKEGGTTMYIMLGAPSRGDKKPRPFKLTSASASKAVFEMPENDFPSKIEYTLKSKGNLFCQISGKPGGNEMKENYDFRPRK